MSISDRSECQGSSQGSSQRIPVRSLQRFPPSCFLNAILTLDTVRHHNNSQQQGYAFILLYHQSYASNFIHTALGCHVVELFVHQCAKSKFLDTLEDVVICSAPRPLFASASLMCSQQRHMQAPAHCQKTNQAFACFGERSSPLRKPDEVRLYLL